MVTKQLTYSEALEELRGAYEREKIQLTAQISALQVSVSQLTIVVENVKKLKEKLGVDKD